MKTAKRIGIGFLIFLILLLVLAMFMSKDVHVESSRNFSAPPNFVFNLVNDLKNVKEYNAWVMEDEEMKLTYGEVSVGMGASYQWDSPNAGKGSVRYVGVYPSDSIVAQLEFEGMDESTLVYTFHGSGDKTKMTWSMDSNLGFPYNIMKWFFKRNIRKGHEQTFDNIEQVLNDRRSGIYGGFQVQDVMQGERNFVLRRDEIKSENTQQFYMQNLGPIFQKIQNEGVSMAGGPCGLFFKRNSDGMVDMAAAIPVLEPIEMEGATSFTIPQGRALMVDYYGDYTKTVVAHDAISQYALDRGMVLKMPSIEEYKTDPSMEKDPSKWLTEVINYIN